MINIYFCSVTLMYYMFYVWILYLKVRRKKSGKNFKSFKILKFILINNYTTSTILHNTNDILLNEKIK